MLEFIFIASVVCIASWLQGSTGLGLGMLAAPVLALVRPDWLPSTIIVLAFAISTLVLLRERQSVNWQFFSWVTIGRIPGTLLGAIVVALFAPAYISILVGVTVICGIALSFFGWRPFPSRRNLIFSGWISGVFGTATSIGGPPIAMVIREAPPAQIRATMSAIFAMGSVISLTALWLTGSFHASHVFASLALTPFMLVGLIVSNFFSGRLNSRILFVMGSAAALVGAVLVIVNGSVILWR